MSSTITQSLLLSAPLPSLPLWKEMKSFSFGKKDKSICSLSLLIFPLPFTSKCPFFLPRRPLANSSLLFLVSLPSELVSTVLRTNQRMKIRVLRCFPTFPLVLLLQQ